MTEQTADNDSAEARIALFDFAFEHAPIGIALVDTRGHIIRGNISFAAVIGIPLDRVVGMPFSDFTHPDDLEADMELFNAVLDGKRDGYSIEKRYIRPAGEIVHVVIHVAAMRDAGGKVVRFITQVEDITIHKRNERELAERATQLELAMEAVRGGFWHMDVPTRRFETSDRLAQFIGGPAAARLDLEGYLSKMNPQDSASADLTPLLLGTIDQSVAQYRLDTVSGERWMRCDRRLLRDSDGSPLRIVGVAIDFTEQHQQIANYQRHSETDVLTGLLNRRGLAIRFPQMTSSSGFSVLAIDLDGFKAVNDRYGHPAGDAVLVETARRLAATVRNGDLVCRTGGDEFTVAVAGDRDVGQAVATRIVESMRAPFAIGDAAADVRASVGGVWTAAKTGINRLVGEADEFLYEAKAAGKDGIRFR